MKFTQNFDKYVCVGDTISADITDKIRLVATVRHDSHSSPSDCDCYSDAAIKRWENEEWFYCGIVLSVQSHDGTIYEELDSLWGIEANFGEDNAYLMEVANDLIAPASILEALRRIYEPVTAAIATLEKKGA